MTSPHWAEVRFLVPPLSKWSAISSDMKVFKSTSWSPFLLRLALEPLLTWVGEPGVLERTLILAIAPLRPKGRKERTFRTSSKESNFLCVQGRHLSDVVIRYRHFILLFVPCTLTWRPGHTLPPLCHAFLAFAIREYTSWKSPFLEDLEFIHQVVEAHYSKCLLHKQMTG